MIHLASKHISNAQQMKLWSKVLKAPGFQPQPHLATWPMERDTRVVAPLAVPAIGRLLHVAAALLSMIERWYDVAPTQKRKADSTAFVAGWKKGRKMHAAAIKPNNWGTLNALARS